MKLNMTPPIIQGHEMAQWKGDLAIKIPEQF